MKVTGHRELHLGTAGCTSDKGQSHEIFESRRFLPLAFLVSFVSSLMAIAESLFLLKRNGSVVHAVPYIQVSTAQLVVAGLLGLGLLGCTGNGYIVVHVVP